MPDEKRPFDWQTRTPAERLEETTRLSSESYGIDPKQRTDRSKWPVLKLKFPEDQ